MNRFRLNILVQLTLPILLLAGSCSPLWADASLIQKNGCDTCHRFSPEQEADDFTAPDLSYAGNKFQQPWLEKFLLSPEIIRKAGHTRDPGFLKGEPEFKSPHMSLPAPEAKSVAQHLMSLKLGGIETVFTDTTPLTKVQRVKTKMKFERDHGCIACHESYNLAQQPRGGISGPSLLDAGNRLQANWVYLWLKDPKTFLPKSRMPIFALDEEALSLMTRYVMSHKKDGR